MNTKLILGLVLFIFIKDYGQVNTRLSDGSSFFNYLGNKSWITIPYYGTKGTFFADVTGDNKSDAIVVNDDGVTIRRSDGTTFKPNEKWTAGAYYGNRGTYFADVNGDGRADAIIVNDAAVTVRISDGTQFLPNANWTTVPYYGTRGTYFADVNGDGKADAIVVNNAGITVRISDGTKFLPNATWTTNAYYGSRGTFFADVNGDGKADAIVVNDVAVTVRISDGTKFLPNATWSTIPFYGTHGTYFADVNGDGKADAIVVNDNAVTVRISDGSKFLSNATWATGAFFGSLGTFFSDVNGDGKADALSVTGPLLNISDNDKDGIDDNAEHLLLERFRPFFMFSNDGGDENFLPADAWWYITKSEMLLSSDENESGCITNQILGANPDALLFNASNPCAKYKSSDITQNPMITDYHINPLASVGGQGGDPGRHGSPLSTVLSAKNIGLYGHVVPIRLTDPFGYDFNTTYNGYSTGQLYYKIEYWQLFGYNGAGQPLDIGDHEGDWTSVQLIYDPHADVIRNVFYFAHGILFRYDMNIQNTQTTVVNNTVDGMIKEFRGINFKNQDLSLSHLNVGNESIDWNDDQIALAQNNTLRLLQDQNSQGFTHPVVYIEHGTHEFFPTQNWSYYGAPNHNGQSYHYLTDTPPNLGEVEFPLTEDRAAPVIMQFNGYWGAYSRKNTPPNGPSLHQNWQWPMSSAVRWLIKNQLGF